jgi:hypothetical protein
MGFATGRARQSQGLANGYRYRRRRLFLMNVQELATAHIEKIGARRYLNNQHLEFVQWEDPFTAAIAAIPF